MFETRDFPRFSPNFPRFFPAGNSYILLYIQEFRVRAFCVLPFSFYLLAIQWRVCISFPWCRLDILIVKRRLFVDILLPAKGNGIFSEKIRKNSNFSKKMCTFLVTCPFAMFQSSQHPQITHNPYTTKVSRQFHGHKYQQLATIHQKK